MRIAASIFQILELNKIVEEKLLAKNCLRCAINFN